MNVGTFLNELIASIQTLNQVDAWILVVRVALAPIDYAFGGVAVLGIVASVVLWFVRRKVANPIKQSYIRRWQGLVFWFGILGLVWFGARYQYVGLFGSRAAFALILLLSLVQALRLIFFTRKKTRLDSQAWEARQQKLKYMR